MGYIGEGVREAVRLILSLDGEVYRTVLLSLRVSLGATLVASVLGLPLGLVIGLNDFPCKRVFVTFCNTLQSIPTVVVGLFVYCLLSQRGPLGSQGLLFTPTAMAIAQALLALPIILSLSIYAVQGIDPRVRLTVMTLGGGVIRQAATILSEARGAFMGGIVAGFGRVIAEVGAAMMVGGNIKGYTRIMTTAIALETAKGEFPFAIALGLILLFVSLCVNTIFHYLQGNGR